jgi:hypothetical protein
MMGRRKTRAEKQNVHRIDVPLPMFSSTLPHSQVGSYLGDLIKLSSSPSQSEALESTSAPSDMLSSFRRFSAFASASAMAWKNNISILTEHLATHMSAVEIEVLHELRHVFDAVRFELGHQLLHLDGRAAAVRVVLGELFQREGHFALRAHQTRQAR